MTSAPARAFQSCYRQLLTGGRYFASTPVFSAWLRQLRFATGEIALRVCPRDAASFLTIRGRLPVSRGNANSDLKNPDGITATRSDTAIRAGTATLAGGTRRPRSGVPIGGICVVGILHSVHAAIGFREQVFGVAAIRGVERLAYAH
jgi:hypothetical protein